MKFFFCALLAASMALTSQAQISFDYKPNGSAVIVTDIEKSSKWYQSVFGVTVKSRMEDPKAYKVVILESPNLVLELLELKGSVPRSEALKGKPDGTQIQGLFKIGFVVTDMDKCLQHLKSLNIDVPRVWTDQSTKKRNFLITDPDGNIIQFFD
jgi:glyoxylase I family protein